MIHHCREEEKRFPGDFVKLFTLFPRMVIRESGHPQTDDPALLNAAAANRALHLRHLDNGAG
jgi:hypothetical protein